MGGAGAAGRRKVAFLPYLMFIIINKSNKFAYSRSGIC